MGLFGKRSNSVSSSGTSDNGSLSSSSAATSASSISPVPKVKASDLNFAASASPNSRVLSLPPVSPRVESAPLQRVPSSSSQRSRNSQQRVSTDASSEGSKPQAPARASAPDEDSSSESSESESENDEPPARTRSSPAEKRDSTGTKATNGGVLAAVGAAVVAPVATLIAPNRSESPTDISDEESDASIALEDFADASEGDEPNGVASNVGKGEPGSKRRTKSRAATLAANAMDSPVKERQKRNKPLSSLTYEDAKLTDEDLKEDISIIWKALHLFLNSRMIEAEAICTQAADHRLYYSVGYSLIQVIKSLATFEPDDLEAAIQCCRDSIHITQLLRKKDHSIFEKGMSLAKGSTSVSSIKSMTLVQRHAELVYAECILLKAVLGIIYSGDFIAFLKEALNMRNAYAIYRTLAKYVEKEDEAFGGEDPSIDQDFRSGVFVGNGMISLILSLLPSTVLKIMEVFGFTGDRDYALATLMKAGQWKAGVAEPGIDCEKEGIRRQIADMILLTHHLVISSYLPVGGVDVPTAANILHYNLDRYPNGVFFLYFAGRLNSTQTEVEAAVKSFHLAIKAQREYIQLTHLCYWDLGIVSLAMGNYQKAFESFNILDTESNWSKAIYAYAKATTLYEEGEKPEKVNAIMRQVPELMQRIAGKSIPLEKFVARRARKFVSQNNRLCLPGLELAYVLNCLGMSPRFMLFDIHLDQVSTVLADLHEVKDTGAYENYWDDYCLAHLLRGIILRFIAYPESQTTPRPSKSPIPPKEAGEQAMISFNNVLKHGRDLQLDHHLVWFAHYELGRLFEARKEYDKAKIQFEQVMSGKGLEISTKKGKGKVTLQNMAVLRTNSALQSMKAEGKIV